MGYNTLKLCGAQICDYLYIQNTPINTGDFTSVDSEPSQWNGSTLLLSKFDENLMGGNSALIGDLSGYRLMRKKGDENFIKYVATLDEKFKGQYVIDYMVANNSTYTYYIYPFGNISDSGVTLAPFITKEVLPKWDYWSLLVVDETDEENVFYLNKMFKFELNLATDDMNNNAVCSITQNFTSYPTIQYGAANYWSSALTSLCGFISCNDCDYVQTPDIVSEFKELTTDGRRKFLKDMDGNVWEVKITAPINISTADNTLERVKSVKVSWTEVGDASDISVINNPSLATNSWVLTKTGYAAPHTNYVWDDDETWDDKKIWTETYSAGRDIVVDDNENNPLPPIDDDDDTGNITPPVDDDNDNLAIIEGDFSVEHTGGLKVQMLWQNDGTYDGQVCFNGDVCADYSVEAECYYRIEARYTDGSVDDFVSDFFGVSNVKESNVWYPIRRIDSHNNFCTPITAYGKKILEIVAYVVGSPSSGDIGWTSIRDFSVVKCKNPITDVKIYDVFNADFVDGCDIDMGDNSVNIVFERERPSGLREDALVVTVTNSAGDVFEDVEVVWEYTDRNGTCSSDALGRVIPIDYKSTTFTDSDGAFSICLLGDDDPTQRGVLSINGEGIEGALICWTSLMGGYAWILLPEDIKCDYDNRLCISLLENIFGGVKRLRVGYYKVGTKPIDTMMFETEEFEKDTEYTTYYPSITHAYSNNNGTGSLVIDSTWYNVSITDGINPIVGASFGCTVRGLEVGIDNLDDYLANIRDGLIDGIHISVNRRDGDGYYENEKVLLWSGKHYIHGYINSVTREVVLPIEYQLTDIEVGDNALSYPYACLGENEVYERNGITFTDNGDGSITLNGTATEDTNFQLTRLPIMYEDIVVLDRGDTYLLQGGLNSDCYLSCMLSVSMEGIFVDYDGDGRYDFTSTDNFYYDYGEGVRFVAQKYCTVFVNILEGAECENLVITPQLIKEECCAGERLIEMPSIS